MIILWVASVVGTLVLAVTALLMVLMTVPVGVRVVRKAGSERVTVELLWLFGAVRITLTGRTRDPHRKSKRMAKRGKAKRRKRKHGSEKRSRRPEPREILVIAREGATLLRRVLGRFRVTSDADLWIGLDDPADTGILWGVTAPSLLRLSNRTGLRVQPSFAGEDFRFTGHAAVGVVPVTVAAPVLGFLLSRDGRTVLRILRGRQ